MTTNNSLDFLKEYCVFDKQDWVWVLVGILRNKDNDGQNKWMRRLIVRSPEDLETCYHDIKAMGDQKGLTYRMYVSLNARNVTKALFSFQQQLLTTSYEVARGNVQEQDRIKRTEAAEAVCRLLEKEGWTFRGVKPIRTWVEEKK